MKDGNGKIKRGLQVKNQLKIATVLKLGQFGWWVVWNAMRMMMMKMRGWHFEGAMKSGNLWWMRMMLFEEGMKKKKKE